MLQRGEVELKKKARTKWMRPNWAIAIGILGLLAVFLAWRQRVLQFTCFDIVGAIVLFFASIRFLVYGISRKLGVEFKKKTTGISFRDNSGIEHRVLLFAGNYGDVRGTRPAILDDQLVALRVRDGGKLFFKHEDIEFLVVWAAGNWSLGCGGTYFAPDSPLGSERIPVDRISDMSLGPQNELVSKGATISMLRRIPHKSC